VEGKLAREYRGPPWCAAGTEVPRALEKKEFPAAERRARTKRREKNISAGAMARERKKFISVGAKKILASTRTQPTKRLTYSRDVFFLPIPLRSIYLEGAATIKIFLKVKAKGNKYFLKVNAKRQKIMMTDKSQAHKKIQGGPGGYPSDKM
jgi:hypothetical protein